MSGEFNPDIIPEPVEHGIPVTMLRKTILTTEKSQQ